MKNHVNSYCARSMRYVNYLLEHGGRMIGVALDRDNSGKLVFYFENDDNLEVWKKNWVKDKETYRIVKRQEAHIGADSTVDLAVCPAQVLDAHDNFVRVNHVADSSMEDEHLVAE